MFKPYAEAKHGKVANALKQIFLDYMSEIVVRRQIFKIGVYLFVPIFNQRKKTLISNTNYNIPDNLQLKPFNISSSINLLDMTNIMVSENNIIDYRNFKTVDEYNDNELTDDEYEKLSEDTQVYNDLSKQFSHDSDFNLKDGVIIKCPLNNFLDRYVNGLYNWTLNNEEGHEGLIIFEFEEKYFYIIISFKTDLYLDSPDSVIPRLVSNKEAHEKAMDCNNIELAKFIDNFNKGLSNIEKDKTMLLDKKEKLLQQINEIDEKLAKLE